MKLIIIPTDEPQLCISMKGVKVTESGTVVVISGTSFPTTNMLNIGEIAAGLTELEVPFLEKNGSIHLPVNGDYVYEIRFRHH